MIKFLLLSLMTIGLLAASEDEEKKSRDLILNQLVKWSLDFNAKNEQGVCSLFAPDLIAVYPGTEDRNYDQICLQLARALHDPEKTYTYDAPLIEDILVSGDIAVVRLTWNQKISIKDRKDATTIKERGIDIFKRQKDGTKDLLCLSGRIKYFI